MLIKAAIADLSDVHACSAEFVKLFKYNHLQMQQMVKPFALIN